MDPVDEVHKKRIEAALNRCLRSGSSGPFQMAHEQLVFVREFLLGNTSDTKLLKNTNLGLLAVREFEARDMTLAELIYEVEDTIKYLIKRGPLHAT